MATTRREAQRHATAEEIKRVAREQMAETGAAALSLRAIAGQMGITAPAIYRYYPNRDALVTALIVDAFEALGAAMTEAATANPAAPWSDRLLAALRAYRRWALEHPAEFALLFGTPIPGYHAPREITVPAARRAFETLLAVPIAAWAAGELPGQERAGGPEDDAAHPGAPLPRPLFERLIESWGTCHGLINLEMTGHLEPATGDAAAAYERAIRGIAARLASPLVPRSPP